MECFCRFVLIVYCVLQNCSSLVKLEGIVLGEVLVSIFCFVMFCVGEIFFFGPLCWSKYVCLGENFSFLYGGCSAKMG